MADEVRWLMRRYNVRGVSVAVARDGRVAWTKSYGSAPDAASLARALADALRPPRDSVARRTDAAGDDVTLTIVNPGGRTAVTVVAHGGWGGRQLVMHVAQRVAIQERWAAIPR